MCALPRQWSRGLFVKTSLLLLLACQAFGADGPAKQSNPQEIEVKGEGTRLTYLDGEREQRDVRVGDRFRVVRRLDSYYVVADGQRQAIIPISSVIPASSAPAHKESGFVITTAQVRVSVKIGRRSEPSTLPAGEVLEVLQRHPLGTTLYVLLRDGRTGEVASNLVRPAKPEEQPAHPELGTVPAPVRLGCVYSVDAERNMRVDYVYAGSLAERIGLEPGTRILKVNGRAIHSAADYDEASRLRGGNLRLLVQRARLDYPEMIEFRDPRNERR